MALFLSDAEISKLLGTVIVDGDSSCIRPNSYYLRLGSAGEFINTGKEFDLSGKDKKGIRLEPGHSVGVIAFETIDFRRETVHKIYPDCDLHGIVSPSTDLSREGVVAPTTQVDAGYHGTLNWTITNAASEDRRFLYKERLFRLTIFKLQIGETPENLYTGEYQSQTGYVRSRRQGAPVGMRETEWEDSQTKGGPEDILENLIKSGYPWHALGQRLKVIDQQFKTVSNEYSEIHDALGRLTVEVNQVRDKQMETSEMIRGVVRDEAEMLQNRWLIGAGSLILGSMGLLLSASSSAAFMSYLRQYGVAIGLGLMLTSGGVLFLLSRFRKRGAGY
jgi:Deoxycytidine deaminase